ncbi:ABC-type Mn2+/Zn2+ transport system, permease component [Xenococcus sp. PCC 7305]|uniref:metal ABC transporter permease n=1 Tax=Xenococcus sp. PCC 7305 TaxID=102125 RepID=UPI0002ACCCC8|nr:metal ABC transporter permease [Xenococcus sp. PCC 7305]ELS02761.1 ABC-type Mn2+/Zn2+ transport system, permease component [Xenococcus sp. PCC 7305]
MLWLIEPLNFVFMRQAIAVGFFLGILSAVVGSYLILQQMGMMSGVISHAVLPGISIAFFLEINLAIGAFIAGILSALVVMVINTRSRVKVDAAMTLALTSFLALGIILINVLETNQIDLSSLLFGDILGVTKQDVWQTATITVVIILLTKLFYKELEFYTFDPIGAKACGLPVNLLYFGLLCAITLNIVASMQTVGVLLVMSLLVGPAITAYLWIESLAQMMFFGAIIGVVSTIGGMYVSYYFDLPSGAAIVMLVFVFFSLSFLFSPTQGIINTPDNRQRLTSLLKLRKN